MPAPHTPFPVRIRRIERTPWWPNSFVPDESASLADVLNTDGIPQAVRATTHELERLLNLPRS